MEYTILFHIMRIVLCTEQRSNERGKAAEGEAGRKTEGGKEGDRGRTETRKEGSITVSPETNADMETWRQVSRKPLTVNSNSLTSIIICLNCSFCNTTAHRAKCMQSCNVRRFGDLQTAAEKRNHNNAVLMHAIDASSHICK